MTQDYPDGWRRNLPGHSVDLEPAFSLPWADSTSIVIPAGGNSSYTLNSFLSNYIYYIDMINISPQAYKEFYVFVTVNGVTYTAGSALGFLTFALRTNPSLVLLEGDSVIITIYNLDSSQRTFVVHTNGSKIIRPATYGHPPSAYFTMSPSISDIYTPVSFTDGSTFAPASWEWDLKDGSAPSALQNLSHRYSVAGSYYPLLKTINGYGYDYYAPSTALVIKSYFYLPNFTEVDPTGAIAVSDSVTASTNIASNNNSYVYKLLTDRVLSSYDITLAVRCGLLNTWAIMGVFSLANAVGNTPGDASGSMGIFFVRGGDATKKIHFGYYKGATYVEDVYASVVSDNRYYYLRVNHEYGSQSATCYIYSDSVRTVLLDTLIVTHADLAAKTFSYVYSHRSYNEGSAFTGSYETSNIVINNY